MMRPPTCICYRTGTSGGGSNGFGHSSMIPFFVVLSAPCRQIPLFLASGRWYMACFHFSWRPVIFWEPVLHGHCFRAHFTNSEVAKNCPSNSSLCFQTQECNVQLLFHYKPTCSHLKPQLPLVFCLHHSLHLLFIFTASLPKMAFPFALLRMMTVWLPIC